MQRKWMYCFAFFLAGVCVSAQAQTTHIEDSLHRVLKEKKTDDLEKVMTMGRLAHHLFFLGQSESSDSIMRLAISNYADQKDGKYQAYGYAIRAFQHRILDNNEASIRFLDSALFYSERTDNKTIKGYTQYCKGWIDLRNEHPHAAIEAFVEGLRLLGDESNENASNYQSSIYSELASVYAEWNDLDNYEKYAKLGLILAEKTHKPDHLSQSLQLLGNSFEKRYFNDTTKRHLLDSSLHFYEKSISVFFANRNQISVPSQLPFTALSIANLYLITLNENETYRDSINRYLDIALEKGKETEQYSVVAGAYGILSDLAIKNGNVSRAEQNLFHALSYIVKDPMPDKNLESNIMLKLSEISEKKGNLEDALHHYKQHMEMNSRIYDADKLAIGKRMEAQYQSTAYARELASMQQEMAFTKKLNRVYVAMAIVCLLAVLFLYYAFRQRNKTLAQQGQLHRLEIEQINQEHRISRLSAMIEGQENERLRLARDLHDGLGGLLSGIKLELAEATSIDENSKSRGLLGKVLHHLDNAIDEMRRIAHSMMPELLLQYGLGEAIKEYCLRFRKKGVDITCQLFNYKNDMPSNRQIVLYRITQELINNVLKHADAKSILVQLQQSTNVLTLTVEDDGRGFEVSSLQTKESAGINNIKSRVAYLNGTIDLQSQHGTGTTVTVECSLEG